MQPLTHFQLEPVDYAGDRSRCCRAQGLLHGPQGVLPVGRLDQEEARWIEPEGAQAMPGKTAVLTLSVSREDEENPPPLWGRVGWGGVRRREGVGVCALPFDPHP